MPRERTVFVFGSSREGRHGAGAALTAKQSYGAIYGKAEGIQGRSYAIITKELRRNHPPVTLNEVHAGIQKFLEFAKLYPEVDFFVTRIGCELAEFKPEQIKPFFTGSTKNVILPEDFK